MMQRTLLLIPLVFALGCLEQAPPCGDNLRGQTLDALPLAGGWCPGMIYELEGCHPGGEFYCIATSDMCESSDHPDCYVGCGVLIDPETHEVVCVGATEYD